MSDAVSRPPLQPIQAAASSDEVNPALIAQIANALTSATAAQPPKNVQSRAAAKPATSKRSGGSTRGYSWTNEEENKLLELRLKEVNRKKENAQQTEGQHGHKSQYQSMADDINAEFHDKDPVKYPFHCTASKVGEKSRSLEKKYRDECTKYLQGQKRHWKTGASITKDQGCEYQSTWCHWPTMREIFKDCESDPISQRNSGLISESEVPGTQAQGPVEVIEVSTDDAEADQTVPDTQVQDLTENDTGVASSKRRKVPKPAQKVPPPLQAKKAAGQQFLKHQLQHMADSNAKQLRKNSEAADRRAAFKSMTVSSATDSPSNSEAAAQEAGEDVNLAGPNEQSFSERHRLDSP
ncbi:hypothetical protein WJX79_002799 [Trebouxia sp. C0005]